MKASQILLQLFKNLPRYTDYFSKIIDIQSLTSSMNVATAITVQNHGLAVGDVINITNAFIKNPIVSLVQVNNVATAITQYDHDLTEGYNFDVLIEGAVQPEYNGTHSLLTVPNRRTFTFKISGNPSSPALGTIFLIEKDRTVNPYVGLKIITSVPSVNVFTYNISSQVYSPAFGDDINALTNIRIGGALSIDKAEEWYSKQLQNDYWLFLVLGDRSASKDRFDPDDAIATISSGTRFRQRVVLPFTCFVFAPLRDDTSLEGVNGREVRDNMEDIFYSLCKSLLRLKFTSEFYEIPFAQTVFVNHGFYSYNQAYYVHQFSFESTLDIVYEDTVEPDDNVAFRDIEINFQRLTDDYIISNMKINLDDVPL